MSSTFSFTKAQHAHAKKEHLPLVGFCIDARYCKPDGVKVEAVGSPPFGESLTRVKKLFLATIKEAYSRRKQGVDHA